MDSLKISLSKLSTPLIICMPIMLNLSDNVIFNISIADIFLPVVFILLVIHNIKFSYKNNDLYKLSIDSSILYILIIVLILVFSLLKVCMLYDMNSVSTSVKNIIKIIINLIYFAIFSYGFSVSKEDFENNFIKIWSYTSVMISILAILGVGLFSIGIENPWSYYYRAVGTFNDPNLLATYLFISISITAIYNYKKRKNIIGTNLVLNIMAIVFTSSRAAIISGVLAVIFILLILLINKEIKTIYLTLVNMLSIGMGLLIAYIAISKILGVNILLDTFERLSSMGDTIKEDSRISQWMSGIKIWARSPMFGVGIGRFIDAGIEYGFTKYRILAHNTYITFLAELGITGLIGFIWFPFILFIKIIKNSMNSVKNQILIFSIIGVAVSCMSLNLENFRCMWVFFTYCYYCIKSSKDESI